MKLANRIAIITGGGSGIGREACKLFAAEGATVIVADRDEAAAEAVASEIAAANGKAEAVAVDVSREGEVKSMIEQTEAVHGRIDILVNNAGYGFAGTVVDSSEEDWDRLMAVNVKGVFFGCKYAIPVMAKNGGGAIVSTASAAANIGIHNRAAYVASKGAVAALTRAMAIDHVEDGVRINAVCPGTIESPYFTRILSGPDGAELRHGLEDRQAMGRMGKPVEIAQAMLWLASDDASFCTGTNLVVDGGWTARGDRKQKKKA
ncbi:MAG: SDR family oxidoreductase [Rhizobiaceae bacterium]|nr:SDR family oxidoreductase [Rhizobiaceae bacterium]MCV0407243.1 SDR family oxidoreductase [Rhizobiaceae bacterium]